MTFSETSIQQKLKMYSMANCITVFKTQPSAKQAGMWHLIKHMLSVSQTHQVYTFSITVCEIEAQRGCCGGSAGSQAFLPSQESELGACVSSPPVTAEGLDKWQVVLKRVPIHRHAELHLDTLLQSEGGLEGRVGNAEAGRSADCQNMSETGKQA